MDNVVSSAAEAVSDIPDGSAISVGGYGLCGIASVLVTAPLEAGTRDLEAVSDNAVVHGLELGLPLKAGRLGRGSSPLCMLGVTPAGLVLVEAALRLSPEEIPAKTGPAVELT